MIEMKTEFVKPTAVIVTAQEYIEKLINANLHKDLHDNEEVCPYCFGTGMVIENNPYGLSDDPDRSRGLFPYKHQAISFCQHCYNGVVHRCKFCGEIMLRGRLKHDCKKQREFDAAEQAKKDAETIRNAPIATDVELAKPHCFYFEGYPYNEGYFFDWDDFFEYWFDDMGNEQGQNAERPEYVWLAIGESFNIDARDIVDRATEDLYDGASDMISDESVKDLQVFLDEWCRNSGIGCTYYQSKFKVRIPWNCYSI